MDAARSADPQAWMFVFWIIVSIIAGVLIAGFLPFWIVIREVQRVEAGE